VSHFARLPDSFLVATGHHNQGLVMGAVIRRAAIAAAGLCLILAACSSPASSVPGFYLPRHAGSGEGPAGLAEGVLDVVGGCFYLSLPQLQPPERYLLIWPDSYFFVTTQTGVAVSGAGRNWFDGDQVRIAGGIYEGNELPSAASGALQVPCDGPYMWVTTIDKQPTDSSPSDNL
jgi:hypothetical protein